MSDAIEAAAKVIDPLAFAEQGSCPPRGWEHSTSLVPYDATINDAGMWIERYPA